MTTHILIHGREDTVGVAVVEDIEAGKELTGWVMDSDETITVEARDPIPLGHKVALQDIAEGDTLLPESRRAPPPGTRAAPVSLCSAPATRRMRVESFGCLSRPLSPQQLVNLGRACIL